MKLLQQKNGQHDSGNSEGDLFNSDSSSTYLSMSSTEDLTMLNHGLTFGDLKDEAGCEAQFRNAFIMGCSGAWSLAPNQIDIARRVFSPDVNEVLFAKRILDAMPDGNGVAMIDGKMQDDATWKQAKVVVDLARLVAQRDPALATAYGFTESPA